MSDTITAPWDPEQVTQLNRFQRSGAMHPFTCPRNTAWSLVAEPSGWTCPEMGCDYTQDWAHAFMADKTALDRLIAASPWLEETRG